MAAVSQLERIGELVDRLRPLGEKRRGMPVEADDWNELVDVLGVLLEVERAQERGLGPALEEAFARKEHKHFGDVGLESLDPELRSLVGAGGASVSTRLAFAKVEKEVDGLGTEVARLTGVVDEQQGLIDRGAVDELERSTKLREFERRFESVEDLRGLVTTLTADAQSVRKGIDTVLELAKSLSDPTGAPIDVADLRDRLEELAALRTNLEGVDGQLLRLRDLELQIREIEDALDLRPGSGLDDRITALRGDLIAHVGGLVEERAEALRDELAGTSAQTREALQVELDEAFGAARGELEAALAARAAETEAAVQATVAARVEELSAALAEQVEEAVTSRTSEMLPGLVSGAVATARAELAASLSSELTAILTAELDARTAALESGLAQRFGALEGELRGLLDKLPGLVAAQVDADLPELLDARLRDVAAELEASLGQRLEAELEAVRAQLEGSVADMVARQLETADIDGRIAAQLDARLVSLDERIAAAVDARAEKLQSEVLTAVDARIAALELEERLAALREQVVAHWQADLSALASDLRATLARELEASVGPLRADLRELETWRLKELEPRLKRLEDRVFG